MLQAMLVTENSIDYITELNDGVRPHDECLALPTYFVYDVEDPEYQYQLLAGDVFEDNYKFTGIENDIVEI